MNALVILAIMGLASLSGAVEINEIDDGMSEFAITTTDTEEVQSLAADLKVFEDFCISSRDWILNDIKQSTNSLTANVFNIFFNSVEALGRESMQNQKVAVEKLSDQLVRPGQEIEQAEGDLGRIIAEGQQRMAGQSTPFALITAVKTAFAATSSSVGAYVNEKLDLLKKFASVQQLGASLQETCDKVRSYEDELKSQLEDYKSSALNGEAKFASVSLDQVKCATARRVIQIEGGCKFAATLKPVAEKLMAGR